MIVDSPWSLEHQQQCGDSRGILAASSHVELQEGQDAVGILVQSGAGIMAGFDGWRGPGHQQAVSLMADGAHIMAMAPQSIDQSDARATDLPFGTAVLGAHVAQRMAAAMPRTIRWAAVIPDRDQDAHRTAHTPRRR